MMSKIKSQCIIVRCKIPHLVLVEEDGHQKGWVTEWQNIEITVPDRGNIGDVQTWFHAAYPEAEIIEIEHRVETGE